MFERSIGVKQRDVSDCGPACLASVARYFGKKMSVQVLRQWAFTTKSGTNIKGMLDAAEGMGLQARAVRADPGHLVRTNFPAIIMVMRGPLEHFIVVFRRKGSIFHVMDPATGRLEKMSLNVLRNEWNGIAIFLKKSVSFDAGFAHQGSWPRIFSIMKDHRKELIMVFIFSLGYTILGLTTSLYIRILVDHALTRQNLQLVNLLSTVMLLIFLFMGLLNWNRGLTGIRIGQHIDSRLNLGYFNHVLRLPQLFFDTMRTGEILSRISDSVKIRTFVADSLVSIAVNLMIVVFSFLIMFIFSWKLACILFSIIPLYMLLFGIFNRLHRRTEKEIMSRWAQLESHMISSIESVSTIHQFGMENEITDKNEWNFHKFLDSIYRSGFNTLLSANLTETISRVFTIVIFWTGAYFIADHSLTIGGLLSFYALIGYFNAPLQNLMGMNRLFQSASIASNRLFELESAFKIPKPGTIKLITAASISLSSVSFGYGSGKPIFSELDLMLAAGNFTVILGKSGSGKSTLLRLIMKEYSPWKGKIFFNNYPLDEINDGNLKKLSGVAPQFPALLPGTILENICMGSGLDTKKVLDLVTELELVEFFDSFPEGFHTYVGEGGVDLSGGQKQVISIIRLLYADPQMVFLDEPASMMDPFSSALLGKALTRFRRDSKTIILVTHQLRYSLSADQVIIFEKGKIIEKGKPEELLKKNTVYSEFYRQQNLESQKVYIND